MSYLPCKNPNCKSYGKPHPNCKCYAEMAKGGEVKGFCESNGSHNPNCPFSDQDPSRAVGSFLAHGASGFLEDPSESLNNYYDNIEKGHKGINNISESLFSDKKVPEKDRSKSKKKLEDWIDNGSTYEDIQNTLSSQGDFTPSPLSEIHPEQDLLIQGAKGRISGYLNNLKPKPDQPKLTFDEPPDMTEAKKTYNQALDIANHPLGILKKVKNGSIEPSELGHFQAMFPETNELLQKDLTQKIINMQLKGEKPSFRVRQGLSLFMDTPLSGEFTQPMAMAAQMVFQNQKQAKSMASQPQSAPKKSSKSSLSKSDQSFLTSNQAIVGRAQKQ